MFKICPPSIDEYLLLDKELDPAPLTAFHLAEEDDNHNDDSHEYDLVGSFNDEEDENQYMHIEN